MYSGFNSFPSKSITHIIETPARKFLTWMDRMNWIKKSFQFSVLAIELGDLRFQIRDFKSGFALHPVYPVHPC
jgi:hypothetical protein